MSVKDLQQTVEHLTREELDQFSKWFEEYMADQWDAQIEKDVLSGKWDAASAVLANHRAGALEAAMKHRADPEFWFCYRQLPQVIQTLADKNFACAQ